MLLERIERHLKRRCMPPTRFGREATGDPNFVFDLRQGREPRAATEGRVLAYIERAHDEPRGCTRTQMNRPHSFERGAGPIAAISGASKRVSARRADQFSIARDLRGPQQGAKGARRRVIEDSPKPLEEVSSADRPQPRKDPGFQSQHVRVGKGWTEQMMEMAEHIGPYSTLLLSELFGGEQIYISADPSKNALRSYLGDEAAAVLSSVYRRERLIVPTAKFALRAAKRAKVLSEVRQGRISKSEAARVLGSARTYISYLINHTDEGTGAPERS